MSDYARRQLLFEVGDYLFAAEAAVVREVLEPAEATPIPGAASGIRGLINLRGNLVVAGQFGPLLGMEDQGGEDTALVVFEYENRQVALEVDRVVGMNPAAKLDLDVDGELLGALGARDLVLGVGRLGARPFFQLDMGAVFARVLERDGDDNGAGALATTEGRETQ